MTTFCFGVSTGKKAMAMSRNLLLWFHYSKDGDNSFRHLLWWFCCNKMATCAFFVVLLQRRWWQQCHYLPLWWCCCGKSNGWRRFFPFFFVVLFVTTPLWAKCKDETHTPKSGNLESFGTPENSKLDCRGQNTLHRGFLYTVGKFLKWKCPKWPCMSHLDICNPSYGQKKG